MYAMSHGGKEFYNAKVTTAAIQEESGGTLEFSHAIIITHCSRVVREYYPQSLRHAGPTIT